MFSPLSAIQKDIDRVVARLPSMTIEEREWFRKRYGGTPEQYIANQRTRMEQMGGDEGPAGNGGIPSIGAIKTTVSGGLDNIVTVGIGVLFLVLIFKK